MTGTPEVAVRIVEVFTQAGRTLATAESLTAGLVSAGLADVPGASAVLRGGAVVYATDAKATVLGVDSELLAARGAVDADVAVRMALGTLRLFSSDVGVATTGVAGPAMQDAKPVGTCFVAVATRESDGVPARSHVEAFHFVGDREEIRRAAAEAAWMMVLEHGA